VAKDSFNLQLVIFNHRIAQQLVRRVVQCFARRRLVRAGGKVNLDIFADVDAGDAGVAHVFEGFFDGDALRVNDRFLGSDDDFSFHSREGSLPETAEAGEIFLAEIVAVMAEASTGENIIKILEHFPANGVG